MRNLVESKKATSCKSAKSNIGTETFCYFSLQIPERKQLWETEIFLSVRVRDSDPGLFIASWAQIVFANFRWEREMCWGRMGRERGWSIEAASPRDPEEEWGWGWGGVTRLASQHFIAKTATNLHSCLPAPGHTSHRLFSFFSMLGLE